MGLLSGLLIGFGALSVYASQITATITGKVFSGVDRFADQLAYPGAVPIFGPIFSLAGQPYTLIITCDTTKGKLNYAYDTLGTTVLVSTLTAISSNDPCAASLTIGNTVNFGNYPPLAAPNVSVYRDKNTFSFNIGTNASAANNLFLSVYSPGQTLYNPDLLSSLSFSSALYSAGQSISFEYSRNPLSTYPGNPEAYGSLTVDTAVISTKNSGPVDLDATGPACAPCQALDQAARQSGITTWNAELLAAGLQLKDTPISYQPPVGPRIDVQIYYSHRDAQQPSSFGYTNFGPKWTVSWLSYITDTISTDKGAKLYRQGGGAETFTFPAANSTASSIGPYSQAVLTRTLDSSGRTTGFVRQLPDGSSEQFTKAVGSQFFMTAVVDRHGNKVAITYDSQTRITKLTDAIGQVTTFAYGLSTDALKVTSITDPFGRSATFTYNSSGQLASITDALGIASSYAYGAGNFVKSLTTPYGTTNFAYGDSSTDSSLGTTRFLTATDPLGQTTRVEYNDSAPGIAASDPTVPTGVAVSNAALNARNTFVWNPYQYKLATTGSSLDYTKAKQIHWLTSADGTTSSRVVASTKEPLEGRVWFTYPGQPSAAVVGTTSTPTAIARVLADGSSQLQTFQYNAVGNPTLATDPVGRRTSYAYASNGIDLLSVSNTTGAIAETLATMTYDGQHNMLTATGANGATAKYSYNSAGQPIQLTDQLGNVTTYSRDGNGYLTKVTGPVANSTYSFTYDSAGRIATATDPAASTVSYTYDNADRPLTATFPDGTKTVFTYNQLDLATSTDRLGQKTTLTHNALRQLTQATDPLGQTSKLAYNPDGKLLSITDGNNHTTTFTLDAQGRAVTKTYADGTSQSVVYESSSSRVAKLIDVKGQTTSYGYNLDDTVASTVYGNASVATPSVSYTYDASYRRLLSMTDGTGTTTYAYYPVKNALALGASQLQRVVSPVAGSSLTDTVIYGYDALGRVISRSINGVAETTGLDALGRVANVANALDTFTYTYADGTPRISGITSPKGPKVALDYFDAKGDELLKTLSYTTAAGSELSTFSYTYDANHNVRTFTESYVGQKLTAMAAASSGQDGLIGPILAAAFKATPVAPGKRWLDRGAAPAATDVLLMVLAGFFALIFAQLARQFRRRLYWPAVPVAATLALASCGGGGGGGGGSSSTGDGGGGGSTASPTKAVTTYAYDTASRLASATVGTDITPTPAGLPKYAYSYDAASNITSMAGAALSYTATNAIASATYDKNGSLTALGAWAYTWDAANRLVKAVGATTESSFSYDGQSRIVRIIDKQNGTVIADKSYLWCGMNRCVEHDNTKTGSPVSKQFFSQGVLASGQALYYVTDHLGTVRQLVDTSGKVQTQYAFDPYGARTKVSGTVDADMGYAGLFNHATTGLDLAVFRAYAPQLGRWINRDPIEEAGGLNIYSYANGNPINAVDPSGKISTAKIIYDLSKDFKSLVSTSCKKGLEKAKDLIGEKLYENIIGIYGGWSMPEKVFNLLSTFTYNTLTKSPFGAFSNTLIDPTPGMPEDEDARLQGDLFELTNDRLKDKLNMNTVDDFLHPTPQQSNSSGCPCSRN
jgi:RHS repeat-associated protein